MHLLVVDECYQIKEYGFKAPAVHLTHPLPIPVPKFEGASHLLNIPQPLISTRSDRASSNDQDPASIHAIDSTSKSSYASMNGQAPPPLLFDGSTTRHNNDLEIRLHELEMQYLATRKQLDGHDTRITSLEARVAELSEIIRSQTSCGANFPETRSPGLDSSQLVALSEVGPGQALEGRTHVVVPPGNSAEVTPDVGQQGTDQPHAPAPTPASESEPDPVGAQPPAAPFKVKTWACYSRDNGVYMGQVHTKKFSFNSFEEGAAVEACQRRISHCRYLDFPVHYTGGCKVKPLSE